MKYLVKQAVRLVPAVLVAAMFSQGAMAVATGTLAGADVNNKATLSFSVGGASVSVESAPAGNATPGTGAGVQTTFKVDRRIDLVVAATDTAAVVTTLGASSAVTTFTVTNNTNDTVDILLTADPALTTGTAFTAGNLVTDNSNYTDVCVIKEAGSAVTRLSSMISGEVRTVTVDCSVKNSATLGVPYSSMNGKINVVDLLGQVAAVGGVAGYANDDAAADNSTVVQNVFADVTAGAIDAAKDGKHSANSAYKIVTPVVTVLKSESLICDPINGVSNPKHIPGALVQYTLTVSNQASTALVPTTSVNLGAITDTLVAELAHDANFVVGGPAASCVPTGTPSFAVGSGFRVTNGGTSTRPTTAVYLTNGSNSDGVTIAGQDVTTTYSELLPAGTFGANTYTAGEVKPGESVTVQFQAFVK